MHATCFGLYTCVVLDWMSVVCSANGICQPWRPYQSPPRNQRLRERHKTFPTYQVTKSLIGDLLAVSHLSDSMSWPPSAIIVKTLHIYGLNYVEYSARCLAFLFRLIFCLHPPRSCEWLQVCSFRTTKSSPATKVVPAKLWRVKGAECRDDQHINREPTITKPKDNEKNRKNPQAAKHVCCFSLLPLFISLLIQPVNKKELRGIKSLWFSLILRYSISVLT
jgi:hypothetical protein